MMDRKNMELKARLSSAAGIVLAVLGLAFLAGSVLAYLQSVAVQIVPLTATGVFCLLAGTVLLLANYVVPALPGEETGDRKHTQKLSVTVICISVLVFLICGIAAIPSYRVQVSDEAIPAPRIPQSGFAPPVSAPARRGRGIRQHTLVHQGYARFMHSCITAMTCSMLSRQSSRSQRSMIAMSPLR